MSEIKPPSDRRLKHRLLAIDAMIDTAVFQAVDALGRGWTAFGDAVSVFRVRGWRRGVAEVLSEGATLGVAGSVVMLALAVPAFNATEGDWQSKGEYAVTFLDKTGQTLGRRGIFLDDTVPLDELPPYLIQSTLATEDRRFFDHFGIDVFGTFRAVASNAKAGGVVQGGSTLTQQLAKNLFLSNERTLDRKIKEAFLALWLEANLSKREILKLYLDRAYMGGGTHGVAAASAFYFGKSVRDLSLAEAAMLSGLYKAPTKYAPHVNLANARARANQVLTNLVDAGFMTEGQVAAARRNPATPVVSVAAGTQAPDWFLDWAFEEVKRIAPEDHTVTVRTTLDPAVQTAAEDAIEANLRQHGQDFRVQQAATVVQSLDGAIRAMVGGRDYGESVFNRAVDALRQPGSSFKPFVYAAAFMNGYSVDSVVTDAPITIGNWSPRNYGRSYSGKVTLKSALARSINTIPVRLAQAIGRDKIVEIAKALGIRSELKITRALPLGVAEVSVIDMTGAYAAFANGGRKATPYGIAQILGRDGRVLYDHARDEPPAEQVLPPEIAAEMNVALHAVVEAGTGGKARVPGQVVAGKTGTTQAYRDAWFVGFTGWYSAAMWLGNDDYTSTKDVTGGSLPALTWQAMMAKVHEGLAPKGLPGVDAPEAPAPSAEAAVAAAETDQQSRDLLTRESLRVIAATGALMKSRLVLPVGDQIGPSVQAPGERRPAGGAVDLGTQPPLRSAANIDTIGFVRGSGGTGSVE